MAYKLITVQTFLIATQAHLAKNLLEAEGIHCYLKNDAIAAMDWRMTQAMGGIQLQVADVDLDRARAILATRPRLPEEAEEISQDNHAAEKPEKPYWMSTPAEPEPFFRRPTSWEEDGSSADDFEPEEPITDDDADSDIGEDDEYPETSPLDELAVRAFRSAVIGMIFFPLQLYVTYLLALMLNTSGKLAPSNRWKVVAALVINIGMIWMIKMMWQMMLREPPHPSQYI